MGNSREFWRWSVVHCPALRFTRLASSQGNVVFRKRNITCDVHQGSAILFDLVGDVLCGDRAFEAMLKQSLGIDQEGGW